MICDDDVIMTKSVNWKNYASIAMLEVAVCSTKTLRFITSSLSKILRQNHALLL